MPYRDALLERDQVWLDVGAYHGSETVPYARLHPRIRVHAFEPDERSAGMIPHDLPNYTVVRSAVATKDGTVRFHLNRYLGASSTRALDRERVKHWLDGEKLEEIASVDVPSIRLDTFLDRERIGVVTYLKIDAQGADLDVLESAGRRLDDILFIKCEVPIQGHGPYEGGHSESDLTEFLRLRGFELTERSLQNYGQEANLEFRNSARLARAGIGTPPACT